MSGRGITERVLSGCWSAEAQRIAALDLVPYTSWYAEGHPHAEDHPHWRKQHPARTWEYAQVLRVMIDLPARQRLMLDVGGAGSPLPWIVASRRGQPVQIIDPEFNGLTVGSEDPDHNPGMNGLRGRADFISCISVIEHVEGEEAFLRDLVELLAPGGVLLLTTDYVEDAPDGDVFQFHWMRKRIYTRASWFGSIANKHSVYGRLVDLGCSTFGACDSTYHGPIPDLGYSFASLCVRKDG